MFKKYIRDDLVCYYKGMSRDTKRKFNFVNIAGGVYHDVTSTMMPSAVSVDLVQVLPIQKPCCNWNDGIWVLEKNDNKNSYKLGLCVPTLGKTSIGKIHNTIRFIFILEN